MKKVRTYFDLPGGTRSDIAGQLAEQTARLRKRMSDVRHTLAVVSGKGGVGKSLVAANLAVLLAERDHAVGIVDADLNGPCVAKLLGAERGSLVVGEDSVRPAIAAAGVKVMSMDLLLASAETPVEWSGGRDESFVWRGTLEANTLREFLSDTEWGELDYLVLDLPPGTDRIVPIHGFLPGLGGLVVVTLPSDLSRYIVRKSLTMAGELGIPVIGYVENMAGYACPECGEIGPLFDSRSEGFSEFERLTAVPFDPQFGRDTDSGSPGVISRPDSQASGALRGLADRIESFFGGSGS